MSVFVHSVAEAVTDTAVRTTHCVFCRAPLAALIQSTEQQKHPMTLGHAFGHTFSERWLRRCGCCGWWTGGVEDRSESDDHGSMHHATAVYGAMGCLRNLDLTDLSIPAAEIRQFLLAKYDARFVVHPRKMEEVVADVFGHQGYQTVVTNYSGDDGIDVILEGPGTTQVGVQVKRYKGAIQVEQIRSFAGALLLAGIPRGIFVTTSRFTEGGQGTAARYERKGYEIDLMDGPRFYEAMALAQANTLPEYDADLLRTFAATPMRPLSRSEGGGRHAWW